MVGLRQLIEHGAVVAATDYPGLGYRRTAPYLVGDSEARAVIDSVLPAACPESETDSFAVWGHSQAGQASFCEVSHKCGGQFFGLRSRVGRQLGTALLMPRLHKIS